MLSEKLDDLKDSIKEYADTNYELVRLEILESAAVLTGEIISSLLIGIMLLFFIFFISMQLAYYLSEQFISHYLGFSIIVIFYLFVAIMIYTNRKKLIENTVCNRFIKKRMSNKFKCNPKVEEDENE